VPISLPPLTESFDLLATVEELELFGEEDISEAKAVMLLQNATDTVRAYCGWRIDRTTEVVRVDVTGGSRVVLPTLLVHEVSEVLADGLPLVATTDYAWSSNGQLAFTGATVAALQVTMDHGYSTVPPAVRAVVLSLALRAHLNPAAHGSEAAAGVATGYAGGVLKSGGLLEAEMNVLDRFRLPPRP
jgi:hypothetical protein